MTKVIVVDDDVTNVGLIKMLLELEGFEAEACTGIKQAKATANEETDVFVVDINLARGTSGLDLLKDIRAGQTAARPDTIVIMTSGDYRRENDSLDAGAQRFLLKPYPPQSLSAEINKLIQGEG